MLNNGQELPEGVYAYSDDDIPGPVDGFYTIHEQELTEKETDEYLTYVKLRLLKSIRNCLVFFVALTIISLIWFFIWNLLR